MISTAHIFYIPVLVLVGAFAGYYLGRAAADKERVEAEKRKQRKANLAAKAGE